MQRRAFACLISALLHILSDATNTQLRASAAHVPLSKPEDFVIVINTDQQRFNLALASRPLRAGIRTFIALDNATRADELNAAGNAHKETYAFFPNRNTSGPDANKPGDTRWQAAPFMAHRHYGPTYKWMLLGDDDTLWFMLGIKRLLHGYDYSLPYAISDHLGDHNPRGFFVPSPFAAVCSPCHWPNLLHARRKEELLERGPAHITPAEAAVWDPTELDGWGWGRLRPLPANGTVELAESAEGAGSAGMGGTGQGGRLGGRRKRRRQWEGGAARLLQAEQEHEQEELEEEMGSPPDAGVRVSSILRSQSQAGHARWQGPGQQAQGPGRAQGPGPGRLPWPAVARLLQQWQQQGSPKLAPANVSALLPLAYYGPAAAQLSSAGSSASAALSAGTAAKPPPPPPRKPLPTDNPIPPPGCPCRPAGGCLHRARLCRGSGRGQELCGRSQVFKSGGFRGNGTWCRHSWAHGGAGVVLSLGLLQATTGSAVEECARNTHVHSCDMNLAMCLMRAPANSRSSSGGSSSSRSGEGAGGFMFTHPGNAALQGATWADPRYMVFDNPVYSHVVHDPLAFVTGRVKCGKGAREVAAAAAAAVAANTAGAEDDEGAQGSSVADGEGAARKQARRQLVLSRSAESSAGADAGLGSSKGTSASSLDGRDAADSDGAMGAVTPMAQQLRGVKQHFNELVWSMDGGGAGGSSSSSGGGPSGRGSAAQGGAAEDQGICEWLVRHAVSVHMHGRSYASYDEAAAAMGHVARSHQKAMRLLWERQQQQALGGRM
ncbi:hypothetical protein HYH02_005576 [Chlamydomonas schloesseri]|uniref:Uncharacterized protein n=1 Tax=Chlamydomonas schloesseri TaxID=2026947 RepID=A0A835WKL8_9CHLO|nr:hypothetical protein HYH02_005576 [Chlamydomonas schloesseri]|eukprot:KAG2449429.1 hypothetical protein HYH02_005576 [Chlamydomonas schloesseri]